LEFAAVRQHGKTHGSFFNPFFDCDRREMLAYGLRSLGRLPDRQRFASSSPEPPDSSSTLWWAFADWAFADWSWIFLSRTISASSFADFHRVSDRVVMSTL